MPTLTSSAENCKSYRADSVKSVKSEVGQIENASNTVDTSETKKIVYGQDTDLLKILFILAASDSSPDERAAAFEYMENFVGGSMLIDVLSGLTKHRLMKALNGIQAADNIAGERKSKVADISLSGWGLGIFVAYCLSNMQVDAGRIALALLSRFLTNRNSKGNPKNISLVIKLAGTSADRINLGNKELYNNGINLNSDSPNAPGAGRPAADTVFKRDMVAKVAAAGISYRALRERQRQRAREKAVVIRYTEESVKTVTIADGREIKADTADTTVGKGTEAAKDCSSGTGSSGGSTEKEVKKESAVEGLRSDVTWDGLCEYFDTLLSLADRLVGWIESELHRAEFGNVQKLREIRELILTTTEWLQVTMWSLADRQPGDTEGQDVKDAAADGAKQPGGSESASDAKTDSKAQPSGEQSGLFILYSVLEGVMATLEALVRDFQKMCNGLDLKETPTSYYVMKKLDSFKFKPYAGAIARCRGLYDMCEAGLKEQVEVKAAPGRAADQSGSDASGNGRSADQTEPRPNFISEKEFLTRGREAVNDLEIMTGRLAAVLSVDGSNPKKSCGRGISGAKAFLDELKAYLEETVLKGSPCEHRDSMAVLTVMIEKVRSGYEEWQKIWCSECTRYRAALKISHSVLEDLQKSIIRLQGEYDEIITMRETGAQDESIGTDSKGADCSTAENAGDAAGVSILGGGDAGEADEETTENADAGKNKDSITASAVRSKKVEARYMSVVRHGQDVIKDMDTLLNNFSTKVKKKRERNGSARSSGESESREDTGSTAVSSPSEKTAETAEDSKGERQGEAETAASQEMEKDPVAVLNNAIERLRRLLEMSDEEAGNPAYLELVKEVADNFQCLVQSWLGLWKKDDLGDYAVICYTDAQKIAGRITKGRTAVSIRTLWDRYEAEAESILNPGKAGIPSHYVDADAFDKPGCWFTDDRILSTERQLEVILKLWNEGKDPTDLATWLEYIIGIDYDRNYGSAWDKRKCIRITRQELKNAVRYFTGFECSDTTLCTILHDVMGYSLKEMAKLDQIGKAHELRDKQYQYIQSIRQNADPRKTLILSIDTKAFIVLGRLKHDNGRLLCCPGGLFRVFDHDFGFKMKDIYPDGTKLVGRDRMDEKAVLHPVAVYCPTDKTGYVSLVLGKDTAESMCNLLRCVIDIKKETMPELENVVILADGGGSNASAGVQWKDQLLRLANDVKLDLQVCHFAPGASKHNPIEHELFGPISVHWKGRPFLDIEHVAGYIEGTRTRTGLRVRCWFDRKKYLTAKEKRALGQHVLTGEELEEKAAGRIEYLFTPEDGDMHKWNYIVHPSKAEAEQAA